MVASLEVRLGVKLPLCTTRRVTTTDAGTVYLERSRRILDEAAHAARDVGSLYGMLRVVMSGVFAARSRLARGLFRLPLLALSVRSVHLTDLSPDDFLEVTACL